MLLLLLLSRFSRVQLFANPWTAAYQAPPSMGFSRQEYWSGVAGKVVWYSHLFKNFPQIVVVHTVKGFGIVNKAEVVFLEVSCFFNDPTNVGNLISGSSAFSKSTLYIWNISVQELLKPSLKDFEHYLASI